MGRSIDPRSLPGRGVASARPSRSRVGGRASKVAARYLKSSAMDPRAARLLRGPDAIASGPRGRPIREEPDAQYTGASPAESVLRWSTPSLARERSDARPRAGSPRPGGAPVDRHAEHGLQPDLRNHPDHLAPPDAYTCDCTCNGGGQSFDFSSNVCLPDDLNPAINPNLPPDFVPAATDVQADCHVRVEQNLEQMARQCFADRIRCTCQAHADLTQSRRRLPHALLRRGPRRRLQQLRSAERPRHGHQRPRPRAGLSRERIRDRVAAPSRPRSSGAPPSARSTAA